MAVDVNCTTKMSFSFSSTDEKALSIYFCGEKNMLRTEPELREKYFIKIEALWKPAYTLKSNNQQPSERDIHFVLK